MNWFGATELVTAAKSAVKGAQKAIDKALDIKEEVDSVDKIEVPGKLHYQFPILTCYSLVKFHLTIENMSFHFSSRQR